MNTHEVSPLVQVALERSFACVVKDWSCVSKLLLWPVNPGLTFSGVMQEQHSVEICEVCVVEGTLVFRLGEIDVR